MSFLGIKANDSKQNQELKDNKGATNSTSNIRDANNIGNINKNLSNLSKVRKSKNLAKSKKLDLAKTKKSDFIKLILSKQIFLFSKLQKHLYGYKNHLSKHQLFNNFYLKYYIQIKNNILGYNIS